MKLTPVKRLVDTISEELKEDPIQRRRNKLVKLVLDILHVDEASVALSSEVATLINAGERVYIEIRWSQTGLNTLTIVVADGDKLRPPEKIQYMSGFVHPTLLEADLTRAIKEILRTRLANGQL